VTQNQSSEMFHVIVHTFFKQKLQVNLCIAPQSIYILGEGFKLNCVQGETDKCCIGNGCFRHVGITIY